MDRSHLLQGLRTGGPNKSSSPYGAQPLSANPNVSRFQNGLFDDGQQDAFQQQMNFMGANQKQLMLQAQMAALMATQGGANRETQALMQMELLRLQALQQQQQNIQAQLLLQSQIAAASQQQNRRRSEQNHGLVSPSVSSPVTPSLPSGLYAQTTRMTATNQLRARAIGREAANANPSEDEQNSLPLSAPATRTASTPLNPNAAAFVGRFNPELAKAIAAANNKATSEVATPSTPTYGQTTVISGGTSLGGASSAYPSGATTPSSLSGGFGGSPNPTKADTATSWRRGSASVANTPTQPTSGSMFNKPPSPPLRQRSTSPPANAMSKLSISPSSSPETPGSAIKLRPSPLRFSKADAALSTSPELVATARSQSPSSLSTDGSNGGNDADAGSPINSTPPSSAGSDESAKKASLEREEASKRLYEGLGIGRPTPSPNAKQTTFNVHAAPFTLPVRAATMPAPMSVKEVVAASQPHRQPIGPPSSADELGPRNFASRLRKKALGGLGVLMEGKDRREGAGLVEIQAF